jgi:hypothetical protein
MRKTLLGPATANSVRVRAAITTNFMGDSGRGDANRYVIGDGGFL